MHNIYNTCIYVSWQLVLSHFWVWSNILIWTTRAAYTNLKIESGYIKTIAVLGISLESENEIEGLKISFCPQTNFSTSLWLALFSKGYRVQFGSNMLHENRWSDNNENHHNVGHNCWKQTSFSLTLSWLIQNVSLFLTFLSKHIQSCFLIQLF